ncbi:hypothetical protein RCL1_005499 [Eukaryota sp. TZLM3-RCL]
MTVQRYQLVFAVDHFLLHFLFKMSSTVGPSCSSQCSHNCKYDEVVARLDRLSLQMEQLQSIVLSTSQQRRPSVSYTNDDRPQDSLANSIICGKSCLSFLKTALDLAHEADLAHSHLVYRATDHGWTSAAFHERCQNLTSLLVLMRTLDGHICGGYTGHVATFEGHEVKPAPGSFIFSYSNPFGLNPFVLKDHGTESSPETSGVHANPAYGPCFGEDDLMCMLETRRIGTSRLGCTFWNYDLVELGDMKMQPHSSQSRTLLTKSNAELSEVEVFSLNL